MQEMFLNNGATADRLHKVLEDNGYPVSMEKDLIPILNSYINRNWVKKLRNDQYVLVK